MPNDVHVRIKNLLIQDGEWSAIVKNFEPSPTSSKTSSFIRGRNTLVGAGHVAKNNKIILGWDMMLLFL